jgi:glycosyltransferase involved in cell wall biosynthesis
LRRNGIGGVAPPHVFAHAPEARAVPIGEALPKISFCTTCMGRRHHLEQVYLRSVRHAETYGNVEFVLLDYGSRDDLSAWVTAELAEWLERGVVRYFRTDEPTTFHMAHAKNAAHRLATGDVLVNLDADNWFEPGFAEELASIFAPDARVIAGFGRYQRGCMGRIAIRRADFLSLGGYDEELRGWGYEDADLARRAVSLGVATRRLDQRHALALQHSDEERTRFTPDKDKKRQHRENAARSRANIAAGHLVANRGRDWGAITIARSSHEACEEARTVRMMEHCPRAP